MTIMRRICVIVGTLAVVLSSPCLGGAFLDWKAHPGTWVDANRLAGSSEKRTGDAAKIALASSIAATDPQGRSPDRTTKFASPGRPTGPRNPIGALMGVGIFLLGMRSYRRRGSEAAPGVPPTDPCSAPLAPRGTRLIAAILDILLTLGATLPGVLVIATLGSGVAVELLIILSVIAFTWYQARLVSRTGQTLAKKWLEIRIVKTSGAPVDFTSAVLLRNWAMVVLSFIPFIGGFIGLADTLLIFGKARRCLHDRIAGTMVIDVSAPAV